MIFFFFNIAKNRKKDKNKPSISVRKSVDDICDVCTYGVGGDDDDNKCPDIIPGTKTKTKTKTYTFKTTEKIKQKIVFNIFCCQSISVIVCSVRIFFFCCYSSSCHCFVLF